jgi:para-nitrobenzyl esterase
MNWFRRLIVAVAATAGLAAAAPSEALAAGPTVDSPAGVAEGVAQGDLRVFKSLPYAQAPVGPLRWRAPQKLPRWSGVRKAVDYGPGCYEPTHKVETIYAPATAEPQSEDCLTLSIWAPKNARNLPVFFWIHGGALVSRSPNAEAYDGSKLARQGMVVVVINYRLGVLGYLAHPGLSAENKFGLSGNYGLLDQIQALSWVHNNISAFGGDPSNVTIAGESAGGLSVMYLMASPPARGLFSKAIAESAYMIATPELKRAANGYPSSETAGEALAAALHAPNVAALRAIDARTITDGAPAAGFQPWGAVDGKVLAGQLVDVFDKGEQAHVPILTGFNAGEIRSLLFLLPPPAKDAAAYEATIRDRYKDLADDFLKLYPSSDIRESMLAASRDGMYGWTSERMATKQAALGLRSYVYEFDHGYPSEDAQGLHAFHGSEIPYIFGTFDHAVRLWPQPPATPQEAALGDAMTSYWASFAKTGKPVAPNTPDWPAWGSDGGYRAFEDAPTPSARDLLARYALDEEVVCRRRAAGGQQWGWNVGLASPPMPAKTAECARSPG